MKANMYGLPLNTDLDFLVGKELMQVCLGRYQSVLHFEGQLTITLECGFQVRLRGGHRHQERSKRSQTNRLSRLLGNKIVQVTNNGGGELTLAFSNGSVLVVSDTNSEYESYQIADPTHTIVV
jgi:hypothetical protein